MEKKMIEFTIIGQPPAKANNYEIIFVNGHRAMKKSKAMDEYEHSFLLQCPYRDLDIKDYFKCEIDVYFKTLASDIDNAAKGILDLLQKCKVIHNDNRCIDLHMRKFKDANNPRCTIRIEEVKL